ncbi:hypothetical protein ERJ75_000745000 [Trypanosoma vivax]|uniref:Uncharacterized protein n=1 Tax=Trypanosoma vivax (strain Y486) TaxID=1055687 RepID=G0TYU0_TRYVY|nr:hypothetical protein TRVL_08637 [Trypanosoma vivax]KAH8613649.1 hypothetical protein ERJ75_000745000 [Trypanosoma vivax]CCC49140.1 conserved hypothetical protein [Trypanosoma vivax Y486]
MPHAEWQMVPRLKNRLAFSLCRACAPRCLLVQRHFFNVNRSVQTRWEVDNQAVSQKRTDYDFDKEQWSKQMRFASMDCIMDPDITPIRYTSMSGIKKAFQRFVTMRKLLDRRPDFNSDDLKKLFVRIKTISHSRSLDDSKVLQRLTTHGEASRISKEIKARMNVEFRQKSWKALKMQEISNTYQIELDSFQLVNCYMGQMSKEDWLQITYKCEFRERSNCEAEWQNMCEYPVFEVRLGDGVQSLNVYPFIVVGIMKKDGTRYGKDSQDAASLRKQFDRSRKWF